MDSRLVAFPVSVFFYLFLFFMLGLVYTRRSSDLNIISMGVFGQQMHTSSGPKYQR